MLIVNDEHRLRAGIKSLSKRCSYCSKPLSEYPLIMNDDAGFHVFHAACAAALALDMEARPLHVLQSACAFPPVVCACHARGRAGRRTRRDLVQLTDLEKIKAALWEQASHPCTRVSWGTAQVMAARKNRGQPRVMLRGRGRWSPVPAVTISRPLVCPTGACDLEEGL